jgi:glutamate 5-kinase
VVKIGSAVLTNRQGYLDVERLETISDQVAGCLASREVFLVSSGAIAAGMGILGMKKRPSTLPDLQAAAAVGQSRLMQAYSEAFEKRGFHAAQVLLTQADFDDRQRYLNARNTLNTLVAMGAVPVINENDTVSVEEIRFSDNDILAALVTNLVRADLLVILTNVDGLYDGDPESRESRLIPVVEKVDSEFAGAVSGKISPMGRGGMGSKLNAASVAAAAGETVLIANGRAPDILTRLLAGENIGTMVLPAARRMASRKRWIGFTARPRGVIVVDEGAEKAIRSGKSLLPSGIREARGDFSAGDIVSIESAAGVRFARGLANYEADQVRRIMGRRTSEIAAILGEKLHDEVVRRENLVLLEGVG